MQLILLLRYANFIFLDELLFPFSERVIMLPHIKVMEAMLVLVNACHNVAIE